MSKINVNNGKNFYYSQSNTIKVYDDPEDDESINIDDI